MCRTSCRFHLDIMRRGKWKTIRRSQRHPCRNIQGIPVRTTDTGQAFFRGLDGTSRAMANGQGFRVGTYTTGHTVAFPHRYAQRVPLAARFHSYGLSRLALSRPRTYKEVLALKERFSPYAEDWELHRSAQEIQPFFASLDSRMAYRGSKEQLLSAYRTFLSETQRKGIHGHGDLTRFVEKEDALFRAFLARLNDYDDMDLSDITRDTENAAPRCSVPLSGRKSPTRKP